jgi:hypothetical protein
MGVFFINTSDGTVATARQLVAGGVGRPGEDPPRPWLRVHGPGDASTLWYAVLRKRERGVYIGTLALRHSERIPLLVQRGWQEVALEEIGLEGARGEISPSPI